MTSVRIFSNAMANNGHRIRQLNERVAEHVFPQPASHPPPPWLDASWRRRSCLMMRQGKRLLRFVANSGRKRRATLSPNARRTNIDRQSERSPITKEKGK